MTRSQGTGDRDQSVLLNQLQGYLVSNIVLF